MLLELLRKRRSVRRFTGDPVPRNVVDEILEAGRLSPSGGNEQPWHFGLILDRELIDRIARLSYNQTWIQGASFLVVLCVDIVEQERGGREIMKSRFPELQQEIDGMEDKLYAALNQEEHQTMIPGTHMSIAALEHGIFSTWVSYFEVDKVSKLLNLPEGCMAAEILVFGYPMDQKEPTRKKAMEEILFVDRYMKRE